MNRKLLFIVVAFMFTTTLSAQDGPTMGWSSWNTYGVNINENLIKRQADAMVSKGLKDVGFDHINIDDGYLADATRPTDTCLSTRLAFRTA